jgi:hypothetical protein
MPGQRLLSLARDARDRAEEISTRAETFNDAGAREGMRRIAASYEKLAQRLERPQTRQSSCYISLLARRDVAFVQCDRNAREGWGTGLISLSGSKGS